MPRLLSLLVLVSACSIEAAEPPPDEAWFRAADAEIHHDVSQIADQNERILETPADQRHDLLLVLNELRRTCRENVSDYNREARGLPVGTFKRWGLPSHIERAVCEANFASLD